MSRVSIAMSYVMTIALVVVASWALIADPLHRFDAKTQKPAHIHRLPTHAGIRSESPAEWRRVVAEAAALMERK